MKGRTAAIKQESDQQLDSWIHRQIAVFIKEHKCYMLAKDGWRVETYVTLQDIFELSKLILRARECQVIDWRGRNRTGGHEGKPEKKYLGLNTK